MLKFRILTLSKIHVIGQVAGFESDILAAKILDRLTAQQQSDKNQIW
jgi:hypothetical protein